MKKKTVVIPFAGFYQGHDFDHELESMFSDRATGCHPNAALLERASSAVEWCWVYQNAAKFYAESFAKEYGLGLEFDTMTSPREYNFEIDRIFCFIDDATIQKLWDETPKGTLLAYCERRHKSRSGFISFYSPDWQTWGDISTWDHNQLGTLLMAWLDDHTGDEWDIAKEWELFEHARGNGLVDKWLCDAGGEGLARLLRIHDYLENRKERKGVAA